MFGRTKYVIDGDAATISHSPIVNEQYVNAVSIGDDPILEDRKLVMMGNKLYEQSIYVEKAKNDPAWMTRPRIDWDVKERVIATYENGEMVIDPEFDVTKYSHSDASVAAFYFMRILSEKGPYVHSVLTTYKKLSGIDAFNFTESLINVLSSPTRLGVIENFDRDFGETVSVPSFLNDIEVSGGKKRAILSQTQLKSMKTLHLVNSIPAFQRMVSTGVLSIDQMDVVLEGFKKCVKYKFVTHSELDNLISQYEDRIIDNKINLELVLIRTLDSFFNLYDISGNSTNSDDYYYYSKMNFRNLFMRYLDAIFMLPADEVSEPKNWRTKNIEKFHDVTTHNALIFQKPRSEEFDAVVVRLRKLKYDDGKYAAIPIESEKKLYQIGQWHNACHATRRDAIIDDNQIIIGVYEKNSDGSVPECPIFCFQVTPRLDVVEMAGFNNEEVTNVEHIEFVRNFRKAKWYLLSNGRTVYREPDEKEEVEESAAN